MVYYATKKDGEISVFDLSKVDYNNLELTDSKSNILNKLIRKAIMGGILPEDMDVVLGIEFTNLLYVEINERNTITFLTNPSVFASMLRKDLKPFAYWLNEYLEVDDVYTLLNTLVNTLMKRLNNRPLYDDCEVSGEIINTIRTVLAIN